MVNATVNGTPIALPEGSKVIEAVFASGNYVPTLCGLEGISDIGACRVCVVEIEGIERLVPACNTPLEDGMVIHTDTPRVLETRRVNVSLLLSQHDVQCATCVRNGNCVLQDLAQELNILDVPYEKEPTFTPWDEGFPLIRDSSKCVRCLRCVQVCHKVQGCDVWDIKNRATRLDVGVRDGLPIEQAGCTLCGQCITHCPTGALRARDDIDAVLEALADPDVVCAVQVAPAVRTSWSETLDLPAELATEGRLAATFRALGFDYVFDTNFGADMTIMEEGSELLERLGGKGTMPMFTSCCPGWVRYLKINHPDKLAHLSSAKSPQQMFGALAKTWYAEKTGIDPKDIFVVGIMPCTAKKFETKREDESASGYPDVDVALTTRELARMIERAGMYLPKLPDEEFDAPLGTSTGAGVIFGATGGVMEAALRTAKEWITGESGEAVEFGEVRGTEGIKEASYKIGDLELNVCVASGLKNAKKVLESVKSGEKNYHFIEIMGCPGGCVNGGGQPVQPAAVRNFIDLKARRAAALYEDDKNKPIRKSHENPVVKEVYETYLGSYGSHKAHEILHTSYKKRNRF